MERWRWSVSFFFPFSRTPWNFERETERRRANTRRTPKSSFLASQKFFLLFFHSSHHPLSLSDDVCVGNWCSLFADEDANTRAEVDNRTLSFSRFVFNTNKKLLGTCLRVHLCVYYALQWFSVYVIQRAHRALSLSLSFRVVYIKILLCVYNTRGAL